MIKRYTQTEAVKIINELSLLELAAMADGVRYVLHPQKTVTYVIDRNINYTNICTCKCKFCAFYRSKTDADSYLMDYEALGKKISDTIDAGGVQILLQGGLHPDLDMKWYQEMLKFIKKNYNIWIHGFSPPEIVHIAKQSNLTIDKTIGMLADAGLDSIPGGGAEVLADSVRKEISPNKINSSQWIDVMQTAHKYGMKTTATMMFRKNEKAENLVEHFMAIRNLQDKTGGFTAFIPWPFQPGNTELGGEQVTAVEYLRVLASARIILDNIPNIQVSWVTQGEKIGQLGLFFGANDFGSVMMEENVVKAAGVGFRLKSKEIDNLIKSAGFEPKLRNMKYELIPEQ